MRKILMAGVRELLADNLRGILRDGYDFRTCETCAELPSTLEEFRPDALIIDLALSGDRPLETLQEAVYRPPVILALTRLVSEQILAAAELAGVDHMIIMPCSAAAVYRRLTDLLAAGSTR